MNVKTFCTNIQFKMESEFERIFLAEINSGLFQWNDNLDFLWELQLLMDSILHMNLFDTSTDLTAEQMVMFKIEDRGAFSLCLKLCSLYLNNIFGLDTKETTSAILNQLKKPYMKTIGAHAACTCIFCKEKRMVFILKMLREKCAYVQKPLDFVVDTFIKWHENNFYKRINWINHL